MRDSILAALMFVLAGVAFISFGEQANAQESVCRVSNNPDELIRACTAAIKSGGPLVPAWYYNRSRAWNERGDCALAQKDLSDALKSAAASKDANFRRQSLTLINRRRATYFIECSGDVASAVSAIEAAMAIEPSNADNFHERAKFYLFKGDVEKAFADERRSIALANKPAIAYAKRGDLYQTIGDYAAAIADYNKAISINPKDSNFYNSRGNARRLKGDYDLSLQDFNEAIRIKPSYEMAYANRGQLFRQKGDLDAALADTNRAIAMLDKDKRAPGLAYSYRGEIYRYRGDFKRALSDFDRVINEGNPFNFAYPYVGRGLTYERLGDEINARKDFEKAISFPTYSYDTNLVMQETARARAVALGSGQTQPSIPAAPSKVASATSIPTPAIAQPKPLAPERAQATAKEGRRVALVIGNSAYKNVSPLTNPQNDADAIAKSLRNIGFETVTLTNDATREKLIDALRNFANESENADWAMVYYAGHGIEVGGVNYLVPVDAELAVDRDIEYEAVPLQQVLRATDSAKKIKLIMLDACRDNPFTPRKTTAPEQVASASTAGGTIASRSTNGRGLAEVKVQGATLVVYAAKDGQVALDGEGGNSPFAVAVVQRLATPGVEINKLFRLVRDDVMEATAGRQEPYTYGSLPGKEDFFFVAK